MADIFEFVGGPANSKRNQAGRSIVSKSMAPAIAGIGDNLINSPLASGLEYAARNIASGFAWPVNAGADIVSRGINGVNGILGGDPNILPTDRAESTLNFARTGNYAPNIDNKTPATTALQPITAIKPPAIAASQTNGKPSTPTPTRNTPTKTAAAKPIAAPIASSAMQTPGYHVPGYGNITKIDNVALGEVNSDFGPEGIAAYNPPTGGGIASNGEATYVLRGRTPDEEEQYQLQQAEWKKEPTAIAAPAQQTSQVGYGNGIETYGADGNLISSTRKLDSDASLADVLMEKFNTNQQVKKTGIANVNSEIATRQATTRLAENLQPSHIALNNANANNMNNNSAMAIARAPLDIEKIRADITHQKNTDKYNTDHLNLLKEQAKAKPAGITEKELFGTVEKLIGQGHTLSDAQHMVTAAASGRDHTFKASRLGSDGKVEWGEMVGVAPNNAKANSQATALIAALNELEKNATSNPGATSNTDYWNKKKQITGGLGALGYRFVGPPVKPATAQPII